MDTRGEPIEVALVGVREPVVDDLAEGDFGVERLLGLEDREPADEHRRLDPLPGHLRQLVLGRETRIRLVAHVVQRETGSCPSSSIFTASRAADMADACPSWGYEK